MIIGADATDDSTILHTAASLYGNYRLRRIYYSAFSPIPQSPNTVPFEAPPLLREHRLYQADFLLRGYGFEVGELLSGPGNLALDIDPKLAWALNNREHFPVDLNRAEPAMIARVMRTRFASSSAARNCTLRKVTLVSATPVSRACRWPLKLR
jgi:predicted DNA-binding helix-hairpin-helix protein